MALFRRSSSDAHWSKDYIEHLRSVHFVLIAVAVTCIAVSRTPDIGQLETAQTQIHQIIDLAYRFTESSKSSLAGGESHAERFAVTKLNDKQYFVQLEPYLAVFLCSGRGDEAVGTPTPIIDWERKLAEAADLNKFAAIWGEASCVETVHEISFEAVYPKYLIHPSHAEGQPESLQTLGSVNILRTTRGALLKDKSFAVSTLFPSGYMGIAESRVRPLLNMAPIAINGSQTPEANLKLGYLPMDNNFAYTLVWYTDNIFEFGAQQSYMLSLVDDWDRHGSFSACFGDLEAVAKSRTQYSLKDLSLFIDGQVAGQSKDFEVVGIKFPKEDLTRWGIILLCSILAYLYLHLRELSPRISSTDEGLDVAWLGLYKSWYSQCLVWLSLVVLPCIGVFLLGKRGAKYVFFWSDTNPRSPDQADWSNAQSWSTLLEWVFLPLAICVTLGILSCLSAMKLAKLADTARNSPASESPTDLRSMD